MRDRAALALGTILLLASPVWAEDCSAEDSGWEAREAAVSKAPNCDRALKVAEACAFGATGDTGLTDIVIEKCEAGFSGQMSKAQRQAYDRGIKRCDEKYKHRDGSMYRSAAAFCRARFARGTAAKFVKARK